MGSVVPKATIMVQILSYKMTIWAFSTQFAPADISTFLLPLKIGFSIIYFAQDGVKNKFKLDMSVAILRNQL